MLHILCDDPYDGFSSPPCIETGVETVSRSVVLLRSSAKRNGNSTQNRSPLIGQFKRTPQRTFTPPSTGRDNDRVLVIDDASEHLPRLGHSCRNVVPAVKE